MQKILIIKNAIRSTKNHFKCNMETSFIFVTIQTLKDLKYTHIQLFVFFAPSYIRYAGDSVGLEGTIAYGTTHLQHSQYAAIAYLSTSFLNSLPFLVDRGAVLTSQLYYDLIWFIVGF